MGARATDVAARFHNVEHHVAHVASAFYCSPFESATGISVDGAGDFATNLVAKCTGTRIGAVRRTLWPHSLGVYYTAICQFIGFDRFGEEYKVMGLSAYGVNRFARELREVVRWDSRAGIRLNLRYFQHQRATLGLEILGDDEVRVPQLYAPRMQELFGPARARGEALSDRDRDLAASMQCRFEDVYLALVGDAVKRVGNRDAVFAGGSVLNSVGNGRVLTERGIDRAYYHPAASDDGTAAGAALYVMHHLHGAPRGSAMEHAYWGSEWSDAEIEPHVLASGLRFERLDRPQLLDTATTALSQGHIVGWFQGREEWGPRALGNRSILCHPGWPDMKATLNARIKNREPFRPFAPAVLAEKLSTCFHGDHEVPFMIAVYRVRPEWKDRLSATTHEDGTGRVQTVKREQNPLYYDLISSFERRTGIPVLLNTSFNENEPIVHTPKQAIDCFARTRMDALAVGSFWLTKPS
ncbi:MAG: carbamoyltransferase [Myxococcales bacterium]|nr:carbamoyltransferase [Myxococcales bacterium]